ncbi:hypothetical protein BDV97DRAFT_357244 [Delphinella strobiligena]|nr:hypothetical protein BDV97DRAFT_357244 [Delphinella strobiligena]
MVVSDALLLLQLLGSLWSSRDVTISSGWEYIFIFMKWSISSRRLISILSLSQWQDSGTESTTSEQLLPTWYFIGSQGCHTFKD